MCMLYADRLQREQITESLQNACIHYLLVGC